jgi:hypothetical protein
MNATNNPNTATRFLEITYFVPIPGSATRFDARDLPSLHKYPRALGIHTILRDLRPLVH